MAGITVSGWGSAARRLSGMAKALEAGSREERHVGTVVRWAAFPEFGTPSRGPQPFFRPGSRQAAADHRRGSFLRRGGASVLEAPAEAWLDPMAEQLKSRVQARLLANGFSADGDLVRSVAIGKSLGEMVQKSRAQVRDPENL